MIGDPGEPGRPGSKVGTLFCLSPSSLTKWLLKF